MCYKYGKFTNFYVGQTNNIYERMQEHYAAVRDGDIDTYTGRFSFVKKVWSKLTYSREQALAIERKIKNMSHSEKWDLIKGSY